jgi:hypothetical protein
MKMCPGFHPVMYLFISTSEELQNDRDQGEKALPFNRSVLTCFQPLTVDDRFKQFSVVFFVKEL